MKISIRSVNRDALVRAAVYALLFLFVPRPRAVRSGVSAGQAKQGVLPSPFSARRACFLFASAPCARLFHFCAALCAAPWESAFLVCKL